MCRFHFCYLFFTTSQLNRQNQILEFLFNHTNTFFDFILS